MLGGLEGKGAAGVQSLRISPPIPHFFLHIGIVRDVIQKDYFLLLVARQAVE